MYDYRFNKPGFQSVQYKNRGPWGMAPTWIGGRERSEVTPGRPDKIAEEEEPQETDPRFARANIGKMPGWHELPEHIRREILSRALEKEA